MKNRKSFVSSIVLRLASVLLTALLVFALQSCDRDDPKPPNEEEVITTVVITLTPTSGETVLLKFFDADGELGETEPTITASGPLASSTTYAAVIELLNESTSPSMDVTEEIAEEANDHLFCFDVTGDIAIGYQDADGNGHPIGLLSEWVTGVPGDAEVTVTLRHQAGTKTGECPGGGETDVQITFPIEVK